jgi:two-component system sensor histidine kinase CiaH
MFRSATFKLTLYYIGLVVTISLIFSVILYQVAANQLASGLMNESARIYTQFPVFQNDPILRPHRDILTDQHRILARLIGFNIIVVVVAGFGSYWLARRTLAPIEEAHEQQKRFTSDVSHELRTPLTALKMETEVALMSTDTTAAELRHTLTSNLEEVAKLETLINTILRLTRLEAEEVRSSFEAVDIAAILHDSVAGLSIQCSTRNITIAQHIAPAHVQGDADSLTQLFITLLDNAIKYSSNGSTVELSGRRNGSQYSIKITDHGIGIEPAALDHVFDRFYRADSSRNKTATGGFGLGLSIAKMIADVHAATITLTSRPKHGTTVTVVLPNAHAGLDSDS